MSGLATEENFRMRAQVWCVCQAKDEADVIGYTVRHMLGRSVDADGVIVANNGSTDCTRAILEEIAETDPRLTITDDRSNIHRQPETMMELARLAADLGDGSPWVIPFDADEIWLPARPCSSVSVRDRLCHLPENVSVVAAELFHFIASGPVENPLRDMSWRIDSPSPLHKVAFRYRPGLRLHDGNHLISDEAGPIQGLTGVCTVRHYPYRSVAQFTRKVRNNYGRLKAAGVSHEIGSHMWQYGAAWERHGDAGLERIFLDHFYRPNPAAVGLVHDPLKE